MENKKSQNKVSKKSQNKSQNKVVSQKSQNKNVSSTKKVQNNKIVPKKSQNYNMEFGNRIARRLIIDEINNDCKKNLAMSPLLIHMSLNMLASGCTGQTLEQLLGFLESDSITNLNDQSSFFMELATRENPGGPLISMVNGIWVDQRFPLKPSFKQLAEDVYKANAQSVDFLNQGEQIKKEINAWAREASKGHIDPLITDDFNEDAIVVLTKALYFKGTWFDTFEPSDTADEDFHLLNGETVKVPFMKKWYPYYCYGSFEDFKLLKMDYKSGNYLDNRNYVMYIFLPDKNDGLQELVHKFNRNPRFIPKNSELKRVELNELWLPKLKFEYELDALEIVKKMGLNLPFHPEKAEIKEMVETSEVVFVSKAIQKSYNEVNEEGTIATAVAEIEYDMGFSLDFPELTKINFIADHPFLFMIKEEVSDTTLFVGAALNPLSI